MLLDNCLHSQLLDVLSDDSSTRFSYLKTDCSSYQCFPVLLYYDCSYTFSLPQIPVSSMLNRNCLMNSYGSFSSCSFHVFHSSDLTAFVSLSVFPRLPAAERVLDSACHLPPPAASLAELAYRCLRSTRHAAGLRVACFR